MTGFTNEARQAAIIARKKSMAEKYVAEKSAYERQPSICKLETCSNSLTFEQFRGGNKFCSRKCGNSTSRVTEESISKMKETYRLKNPDRYKRHCVVCNKEFEFENRKICCSPECKFIRRKIAAEKSNKTSQKNGSRKGWSKRTKEPSYPEKYFISIFENENIKGWIREKKVGKWFIDFAFQDKMLAVEIDGAQHEFDDRKKSDMMKDEYLVSNGWRVIRIKWSNPVSETNRNKLYPQIENLKKIIKEN